jgi:hypothetical protein
MSALWADWQHSADSTDLRTGEFIYSFTVAEDIAAGVATGFRFSTADTYVFRHGLRFTRSGAQFSVRIITDDTLSVGTLLSATQYHITRVRERVYYSYGDGYFLVEDNGAPFLVRGTVIGSTPAITGEAQLHTRFLSAGDSVCSYSFRAFAANLLAVTTLAFSPLVASSSSVGVSEASATAALPPMEVLAAAENIFGQVDIAFEVPVVSVNTLLADQATVSAVFAPMQVAAYEEVITVDYVSTFAVSAPLQVFAFGMDPSAKTDISFAPMSVYVGENEWAGASVSFAPLEVTALSGSLAASSPIFYAAFAPTLSAAGEYDVVENIQMAASHQLNYGLRVLDQAQIASSAQTFWTQTLSLTDTVRAILTAQPALAVTLTELVEAEDTINFVEVVTLLDRAGAFDSLETFRQLSVQLSLLAAARDLVAGNPAVVLTDELEAEDATQTRELIQLLESLEAAMTSQQVMTLVVEETLGVQAADSTETLGHYLANVTDNVGAWLGFRLGDETFTGWVMNTEGEKPLSEYTGYNFNSFCRVGDRFYGAGDDGLYLLEGDTDNGEPIDAAIRTMMIDFGSPVQKRVRNAYLGYTASGKLLLRVRTVDQGQMNEQWYEAQELPAQAPREQMVRLGRGLRSRYWQFELVNIDGADFEIDTLELHPVYLNRRV